MAQEITVGGVTVPLTHPDKILVPGEGITKTDLARYYADVAGAVLEFSRRASDVLARRYPDAITTEQRKDKRGMRIYADVMRNAYAQTVVASYSLRARPGAAAAVPLSWDEVEDGRLDPGQFTM